MTVPTFNVSKRYPKLILGEKEKSSIDSCEGAEDQTEESLKYPTPGSIIVVLVEYLQRARYPSAPDDPDVPLEPLDPEVPEIPLVPDVPRVPEVPLDPELPEDPDVPLAPEDPELPEVPELPDVVEPPELTNPPPPPEIGTISPFKRDEGISEL